MASCNTKIEPVVEEDPVGGTDPGGNNTPGGNTDPGGNNNPGGNTDPGGNNTNPGSGSSSSKNADIVQIETSGSHTLVLLSDNTLWGTGDNRSSQLGLSYLLSERNTLIKIADNVKLVKTVGANTLIIKTDDSLWGCGSNSNGELGLVGHGQRVYSFDRMANNVRSVDGYMDYILIVKKDNTLWGGGLNEYHLLSDQGSGSERDYIDTPVKIADNVKEAVGGNRYILILKNDNTLWGRGWNFLGQLGLGTIGSTESVVKVTEDVKKVVAGVTHSGIIKSDNSLWVTGNAIALGGTDHYSIKYDALNQIIPPMLTQFSKVLDNVKDASFGIEQSLVLLQDNTLWGAGRDALGSPGGTNMQVSFVKIRDNVLTMNAGGRCSFILENDKTLWSTGSNERGQLGDGTSNNKETFVRVHLSWKE